ncbi:MAG: DUF3102 domain-containing protein [Clostridia bacterium]|nr:DUF3102 domain-containing protein [Clostridia bacterium]
MENNIIAVPQPEVPARDIGIITAEIKEVKRQANNMALMYAIEIGRRLVEAKSVLQHGEWGEWLKNEVDFSQSSANNFMKLYEEYGQAQISVFGAVANSQTIGNLAYSKALQLLALPENEREKFAEEVGAEDMTVKELKAAIDERNAAVKRAEEAEKKAEEIARKQQEAEAAVKEAAGFAKESEELKARVSELENELAAANEGSKLSTEELDSIKADALKEAKEKAAEEVKKKLEKAKASAEKAVKKQKEAEQKALELQERLEATQKQLKTATPEIAAFKTLFDELQKTAQSLKLKLEKIKADSPDVADKLSAALKAFGQSLQS